MLLNKRYIPPPKSNATCQLCQDLHIPVQGTGKDHYGSLGIRLQDLPIAAKNGCVICDFLWASVTELCAPLKGFPPLPEEEVFGIRLCSVKRDGPLIINVLTEYAHCLDLEMYVRQGPLSSWPLVGPARDVSTSGSSEECVSLAMRWIDECLSQHGACAKETNPVLPSRVLDVTNGKDPRLRITGNQERGKYLALSHCWGGKGHFKTELSSLQKRIQGIPFAEIPKTFQDAITICRLLGVDSLWIDSLCIIQDSANDWAEQAAQMSSIYANAFVTISADGAANSSEGFLANKLRNIKVHRLSITGSHSGKEELCIRRKGSSGRDSFSHHAWAGPQCSPLASRGWVLQESVLSPRILHFTTEELTWECSTTSQCECQCSPHAFEAEEPLRISIDNLPFHQRWHMLVDEYTDRQLTYWTDRLPAISGIAQSMQKSTDSEYWAGLWSDSFPYCLLWRFLDRHKDITGTTCTNKRVQPYHAPTWSWASITGRVSLPWRFPKVVQPQSLEIKCKPATSDRFGSLQSGELIMDGFLVEIAIKERDDREFLGAKYHCFSKIAVENESLSAKLVPDVDGEEDEIILDDRHWALAVTEDYDGMIALRASSYRMGAYERIGILDIEKPRQWVDIALKQRIVIV